jgi:hypothetical protein
MATFLYRCPNTRLRVQGWIADEWSQPETQNYEAMNCIACGGVHLVNWRTVKPSTRTTIIQIDSEHVRRLASRVQGEVCC